MMACAPQSMAHIWVSYRLETSTRSPGLTSSSMISGLVPMQILPLSMWVSALPTTSSASSVSSRFVQRVLAAASTAVSNRSMFASAMSLMVISPCSSLSPSTMQSVSISTSRIRFQAARRLISPSMPACLRMSMSLICGLTSVQSRGGSTPKCCRTNRVSRFTCPARRASYRPVRLPRFFSQAYASAEQIESVSGFWWPMMLMWRTVLFAIVVLPRILCFPHLRVLASLWEGGAPKGRRERTLPLPEAFSPGQALSPTLCGGSPLPEGAKENVKPYGLISVKYHYNNPYYSTHFCVLRFLTNTTL